MRSTWATIDGIFELLEEAQLNDDTVPFPLLATLEMYQFQPPDFRFDGMEIEQGLYIYFEDTEFQRSDGGVQDASHSPDMNIDIVVSKKAEINTTTGAFRRSNLVAEADLRTIVSQVYDAINDTRFLRLLNDKISLNTSVSNEFRCSELWTKKASKLGTLRFTQSSKTISIFRLVIQPEITEVHTNNPGTVYTATDDHITPYRDEDDYEAPA